MYGSCTLTSQKVPFEDDMRCSQLLDHSVPTLVSGPRLRQEKSININILGGTVTKRNRPWDKRDPSPGQIGTRPWDEPAFLCLIPQ